jgi:hypothetical protein
MIEGMQIRNLAPLTQTAYVQQVSLFARHFGQPPECLGRVDCPRLSDLSGAGQAPGGQFDLGRGGPRYGSSTPSRSSVPGLLIQLVLG